MIMIPNSFEIYVTQESIKFQISMSFKLINVKVDERRLKMSMLKTNVFLDNYGKMCLVKKLQLVLII